METIVALGVFNETQKEEVRQLAKGHEVVFVNSAASIKKDLLERMTIALGTLPVYLYKKAKNLKWLQTNSAGCDQYFNEDAFREDVIVTNATGAYGMPISEYMLSCVLGVYKRLFDYKFQQPTGAWKRIGDVRFVAYSTVVCLGTGDIGGSFARKMKALGAYTIGIKRTPAPTPDYFDELYTVDHLEEILPRADILALSLPGTPLTKYILNKKTLALLKKDVLIINVGRGNCINTEDLYQCLKENKHIKACVDVLEKEPFDSTHPIWQLPNIFITPHISGGNYDKETADLIYHVKYENLKRYLNGEKLYNVVDPLTGYKISNSEEFVWH